MEQFKTFGPYAYQGTARGTRRENLAAHGCVRYVDVRADGFTRERNVNGGHEELGRWYAATKTRETKA